MTRSGELKEFGTGAKFENARFLASLLLDTVNVALAFGVARDADPGLASYLAGSSAAAHTLNLLSALGQEYAKTVLKDKSARTAARVFFGVRGAGSAVFAAKNLHDMWRAFEKGDRDNAIALALASAAEAASAVGYLISAFAATSAAGPWIAAVATLVAAGAYIAAELLSDDELATFLSHSKWGSRPYADPELLPKWAIAPVSAWQGDYAAQRRLLFKLLTRFSVAWASHGICAMGIEVNPAVVTRDSVLKVLFVARRDGEDTSEELAFRADALPQRFPDTISARPHDTLRSGEPPDLIAVVTFQWHPDEPPDRVVFTLRAGGVDQPDRDVSSLGDEG